MSTIKALAGITAFITICSLANSAFEYIATNQTLATVLALGFIGLVMWGAIKLASIVLDKIEGK